MRFVVYLAMTATHLKRAYETGGLRSYIGGATVVKEAFVKERLIQAGYAIFVPIMRNSPERDHGIFKLMMTIDVDGQSKPLLVMGNAHSNIEDGQCMVVLNPDESVGQELHGGAAYNDALFKEAVSGKCDEALYLWFDIYKSKDNQITVLSHYRAREQKPSKFQLR